MAQPFDVCGFHRPEALAPGADALFADTVLPGNFGDRPLVGFAQDGGVCASVNRLFLRIGSHLAYPGGRAALWCAVEIQARRRRAAPSPNNPRPSIASVAGSGTWV